MSRHRPREPERSVVDEMMETLDRKAEVASQYEASAAVDDLLVIAAERLALATFTAMNVFRASHLPGILWLRVLKFFAPGRYQIRLDTHNSLFVDCLVHAADRLLGYVRAWHGPATEWLNDTLVTWSAAWHANILRYSAAEKAALLEAVVRALAERDKSVESNMGASELILRRDKLRRACQVVASHSCFTLADTIADGSSILFNGIEFVSGKEKWYHERIRLSLRKGRDTLDAVEIAEYIAVCSLRDPVLRFVEPYWLAKSLSRFNRGEDSDSD